MYNMFGIGQDGKFAINELCYSSLFSCLEQKDVRIIYLLLLLLLLLLFLLNHHHHHHHYCQLPNTVLFASSSDSNRRKKWQTSCFLSSVAFIPGN